MRRGINWHVTTGFLISSAATVLLLPFRWLLAAGIAAFVHEGFHAMAIRLLGFQIYDIRMETGRIQMETEPMSAVPELICAGAGPVGSLLLALFLHQFPLVALWGLVQGLYNLIPISPMDGGRMVSCICALAFRNCGASVAMAVQFLAGLAMFGVCFIYGIRMKSLLLMLLSAGIGIRIVFL